ncbi:unnamed protein product [Closterium sp. NIES-65]|nr:unnamed protein product [Closterium sp. NIES-65]
MGGVRVLSCPKNGGVGEFRVASEAGHGDSVRGKREGRFEIKFHSATILFLLFPSLQSIPVPPFPCPPPPFPPQQSTPLACLQSSPPCPQFPPSLPSVSPSLTLRFPPPCPQFPQPPSWPSVSPLRLALIPPPPLALPLLALSFPNPPPGPQFLPSALPSFPPPHPPFPQFPSPTPCPQFPHPLPSVSPPLALSFPSPCPQFLPCVPSVSPLDLVPLLFSSASAMLPIMFHLFEPFLSTPAWACSVLLALVPPTPVPTVFPPFPSSSFP